MMISTLCIRFLKRRFLPLHKTFKRLVFLLALLSCVMLVYYMLIVPKNSRAEDSMSYQAALFETTFWQSTRNITRYPIIDPAIAPKKSRGTYILVLISSKATGRKHYELREMIRNTWASTAAANKTDKITPYSWRAAFIMAKSDNDTENALLTREAAEKGDIIIGNYIDRYSNITVKLLMGLKWASQQQFSYLLKTDDDVYVNIPRLVQFLQRPDLPRRLYAGVTYSGNVVRDENHRHYVPVVDYPNTYYPTFCKGSMYIMSAQVLRDIVQASQYVCRIGIDDAYVGIVADKINVKPYDLSQFVQRSYMFLFVDSLNSCQFREVIGLGDGLSPYQMQYIHTRVLALQHTSDWICLTTTPMVIIMYFFIISVIFVCIQIKYYR